MDISEKFACAAQSCVGAPFRLQGRDPSIGLDCVGLIAWCARACALPVDHLPTYTLTSEASELVPHLVAAGFDLRDAAWPQVGDVMIFDMNNRRNHVAVCTNLGMVHADMRFRRVVEHHIDEAWRSQITQIYGVGGC